jgi:hypothetical protein
MGFGVGDLRHQIYWVQFSGVEGFTWSRDSSVGIATGYGLDDQGSEFEFQ